MKKKVKYYLTENLTGILFSLTVFLVSMMIFMFISDIMYTAPDTPSYVQIAQNILKGKGFSMDGENPDFFRTPGYPLFLSIIYAIHGNNTMVVILQYLLSALCVYLTYRIGKLLKIQSRIIWLIVIFLSMDINLFIYNGFILSDGLFRILLMFALFFWLKYLKIGKNIKYFFWFSFFMNYALLVRPILLYFNIILLAAFVIVCFFRSIPWRHFLIYAVFLMLFLGGWIFRNYSLTGTLEYSTVKNYNLLAYDSLYVYNYINGMPLDDRTYNDEMMKKIYEFCTPEMYDSMNPIEQAQICGQAGKTYLAEHKLECIKVNLKGAVITLLGTCSWWLKKVIGSTFILKLVQVIYGFYLLISYGIYAYSLFVNRKKLDLLDFSIFIISLYLLIASMSVGGSRFRIAFFGLLLMGSLVTWREADVKTENCLQRLVKF